MAAPLSAQRIEIAYAGVDTPILRSLDIDVRTHEMLAIVGPNGSGKSTLVRALSRVLRPAAGTVLLDGRDLYSSLTPRDASRIIGVVSQTTTVAFDFTVSEIVTMGRMPHLPAHPFAEPRPTDREIVDRALATMGAAHLAGRTAASLSGGEQQRVMIARALAQEPDVLLLDEPTAHLDIHHQLAVLALLRRLAHKEGKAVLIVLHDLNLAAAYADRMVLLRGGEAVASGTPSEVLSAGNVEAAYGTRVWLRNDPASGRPYVTALPEIDIDTPGAEGLRVHLIAGGGTGASWLLLFCQLGCAVTMGALNLGDTDQEAAEALEIPYAHEKPFTSISDDTTRVAAGLAADAQVVVLTDVPFGRGNLANLEHAAQLAESGKKVLVVDTGAFSERDFTGGAATKLWEQVLALGAERVASPSVMADRIRGLGARPEG